MCTPRQPAHQLLSGENYGEGGWSKREGIIGGSGSQYDDGTKELGKRKMGSWYDRREENKRAA